MAVILMMVIILAGVGYYYESSLVNSQAVGLVPQAFCKLTSQSATVTCATFTTPTGATSTYVIPCYVTATGGVNHGTCQVVYTEANTNAVITLTIVTAINLNTIYTAEDVIWVAPNTVITVSLQVTSGTFNIAGAIVSET